MILIEKTMADISRSAVEDILFNMRKKLEEQSSPK